MQNLPHRIAAVVTLAATVGLAGTPAQAQRDPEHAARPVSGRSVVATRYGIVASSQPLASMAGVQCSSEAGRPSMRRSPPTRRSASSSQ